VIPAVGLFLLLSANPFAQSNKLPAPGSYVSDFAGVIDSETKSRLESLLQKLKEKSKIELYVATVDSTGAQEISAFSQQLARDWNIGAKTESQQELCCWLFRQLRRLRSLKSAARRKRQCPKACWVR
jgi:uncharacterized membrane protein YgcG